MTDGSAAVLVIPTRSTYLTYFISYDTWKVLVARASPGDATARVLDLRMAQEITLQLPTVRARSLPARGYLHRI